MNERRMRRMNEQQRHVAATKLAAQAATLEAAAAVIETAAKDDDFKAVNEAALDQARSAAIAFYRSKDFEAALTHALRESAKNLIAEEVAARIQEMQARVRARVAEGFDRAVEQVAREQFDQAIAELRSSFAAGRKVSA